jgi:hypothetical protein
VPPREIEHGGRRRGGSLQHQVVAIHQRRLCRDQPVAPGRACRGLLQSARHGRALSVHPCCSSDGCRRRLPVRRRAYS